MISTIPSIMLSIAPSIVTRLGSFTLWKNGVLCDTTGLKITTTLTGHATRAKICARAVAKDTNCGTYFTFTDAVGVFGPNCYCVPKGRACNGYRIPDWSVYRLNPIACQRALKTHNHDMIWWEPCGYGFTGSRHLLCRYFTIRCFG